MFILGLTPDAIMTLHQLDQYADLNIAQRISMLPGDGQVVIFGEQKYGRLSSCIRHRWRPAGSE